MPSSQLLRLTPTELNHSPSPPATARSKSRKKNKKIKNKRKSLRRKLLRLSPSLRKEFNHSPSPTAPARSRRTYKNRRAVKGLGVGKGILGIGKDGCIIDSLNCPPYSKDAGYVAKLFKEKNAVNAHLQSVLLSLDPDEKRFAQYKVSADCLSSSSFADNKDVALCEERLGSDIGTIAFMWMLEPIDEKHLTKSQYRYLRESLEILHSHGITHGDLPGNVMIHPIDKMPRIIDWENARINHSDDTLGKQMDNNAFLMHFKIG